MKKLYTSITAGIGILFPVVTFAATNLTLRGLIATITEYLNDVLFLLMGLAVVFFVWYIIQYFIRPGSTDQHKEAGTYMLYSIIGFFVILSFWGIVNILQNTFRLSNTENRPSTWSSFQNLFPSGGGGGVIQQPRPLGTPWFDQNTGIWHNPEDR